MMGLLANRRWMLYWIVLMLFILGMLQSCVSVEKQVRKAKRIAYEHPNDFADFCARIFPVKDSIGQPVVTYVPADNRDYTRIIDSLSQESEAFKAAVAKDTSKVGELYRSRIESLTESLSRLKKGYKKCLPDTVEKKIPVYVENTAKLTAVQTEMSKMNNNLIKERTLREGAENGSKSKNWWIGGLGLLLLASIYFHLRKIF